MPTQLELPWKGHCLRALSHAFACVDGIGRGTLTAEGLRIRVDAIHAALTLAVDNRAANAAHEPVREPGEEG